MRPSRTIHPSPTRHRQGIPALALIGVLALTGNQAGAQVYYMATNGTNNNDGKSIGAPFAQLTQFCAVMQPGDTLQLRGGTYADCWGTGDGFFNKSGTAQAWITITNYQNEMPILDGSSTNSPSVCIYTHKDKNSNGVRYIRIQNLVFQNWTASAIDMGGGYADSNNSQVNAEYWDVRNNIIDQCGRSGIDFRFSRNITCEYNLVGRTGWNASTGSWSSNINLWRMIGGNNIINGNVAYHAVDVNSAYYSDGNGFILDLSATDGRNGACTVTNNILAYNGGAGIAITESKNATCINNTLYENGQDPNYDYKGKGFVLYGVGDNFNFANNLVYQSSGTGMFWGYDANWNERTRSSYPGSTFDNNNASGYTGYADAKFANGPGFDFVLQTGSPAIDSGKSSGAPSNGMSFDQKCIKSQTSGQKMSWYKYAPDLNYISSKGGLKNVLKAGNARPQGNGIDKGAIEGTNAGGGGSSTVTITAGGKYRLKNVFSGKYLCANGGAEEWIIPTQCNDQTWANLKWTFTAATGGGYVISPDYPYNRCLSANSSTTSGVDVYQAARVATWTSQEWTVTTSGMVIILSPKWPSANRSFACKDANEWSGMVQVTKNTSDTKQQWTIESTQ